MKEFLSHLHVAKPVLLFLLLLLPIIPIWGRGRSWALILWRCIIVSLLVIALAEPGWVSKLKVSPATREGERVFAFDLSRSMPMQTRRWMERTTKEKLSPSEQDRMFVFGGDIRRVDNWEQWVRGDEAADFVQPGRTNLERLFSSLLALPEKPQHVFLFTDGWENEGSVERLFPSLASSGMKVFPLLQTDHPVIANVAIKRILAPHQATSREEINLKILVENQNDREVEGSLTLKRNGQPFKSVATSIKPGSQILNYQVTSPEGPLVSFEASFTSRRPELDLFPQDNRAIAWVAVRPKDKVLLLNGRSGEGKYLEELLKRRGFEVVSLSPGASAPPLAGYGLVIFNNIERQKFSHEYLTNVERHVARGNAFIMLGNEGSFAPGGYQETPIETVLPVGLKEPKKEEKNRAVIFVIDKSGSMREGNKLLYATQAAKAALGQFKDGDLIGVVGFDVSPFVVVPLTPVERLRGILDAQIDRLRPGGRTYVYPAIVEAKRQLERQSGGRKHVIILSDGITSGTHSEYIELVSVMKKELSITTSAVAIGDDADIALMKRLSQYGGGFFHHAFDPKTLPQIVVREMEEKSDEKPAANRDFTPIAVRGSEMLEGFPERFYPPLKGYIETELKRGAQLHLTISRVERRPPILASWSYGKGTAIAFTTDLSGHWSREWIRWPALERFWGKVFDWLRPIKEALPPHEVRINLLKNQPVLDLYLFEESANRGLFRYTLTSKQGKKEGVLQTLAPGHYQASLPISNPGDYRIDLTEERQEQKVSYPPLGHTLTFDPRSELPRNELNITLLEQLARVTGGEINPKEVETRKVQEETVLATKPLRSLLILLASILFLLEIMLRRFVFRPNF
jgi:Ca-activated chloride channel family protein